RRILLRTEVQRQAAHAMINSMPLDGSKPLEIIGSEEAKARKLDQNALMWVGPLADIAQQAYHQGRTYSAELWHELFKEMYLPEDDDPEIRLRAEEGYRKWEFSPNGDAICVGCTSRLSVTGFSRYLGQVQAHGASVGVIFPASPRERLAP